MHFARSAAAAFAESTETGAPDASPLARRWQPSEPDPSDLDCHARHLNAREAACRVVLGELAAVLCQHQMHHRLGFARLGDYTRERLGLSPREVESLAQVATSLRHLPTIAASFAAGHLSWTHTRLLAAVATPQDEAAWLEGARGRSAAELVASIRRAPHAAAAARTTSEDTRRRQQLETALDDSLDQSEGEPTMQLRVRCPPRLKNLFYDTVELARRTAGAPLSVAQAAEAIAAEALSGAQRSAIERATEVAAAERSAVCARSSSASQAAPRPLPPDVAVLAGGAATVGPFDLDARLQRAVRALRTVDCQLGSVLATVHRRGLHRRSGFRSLAEYVRDRFGIAPRTARALMAAERATAACTALRNAYFAGDLSRLQTLTLAPAVVGAPENVAAAWVARARCVTLRRLTDEVAWALTQRDAGDGRAVGSPPRDARAHDDAERHSGAGADDVEQRSGPRPEIERHIGARVTTRELVDTDIAFTGPASIVALFRLAVAAFASASAEPAWRSCERMLAHVRETWNGQPRHRDPVFERDGWRCTVPACSGRRNLHDHHVRFRSRGGDNRRTNRITVCAWHHLRAIHCGLVRAWGTAPDGIRWQLGLEGARSWALLDFLGDRYLDHDEVLAERRAHKRQLAAVIALTESADDSGTAAPI